MRKKERPYSWGKRWLRRIQGRAMQNNMPGKRGRGERRAFWEGGSEKGNLHFLGENHNRLKHLPKGKGGGNRVNI